MAYKLKTRSSASKRYKKTSTGKIIRRRSFRGHILEKKSPKQKRNLKQKANVFKGEVKIIERMLPY